MANPGNDFFAWMKQAHPGGTVRLDELIAYFANRRSDQAAFAKTTQAAFEAWWKKARHGEKASARLQQDSYSLKLVGSEPGKSKKNGAITLFAVHLRHEYRANPKSTWVPKFELILTHKLDAVRARVVSGSAKWVPLNHWPTSSPPAGYDEPKKTKKDGSLSYLSPSLGEANVFVVQLTPERDAIARVFRSYDDKSLDELVVDEWLKFKNTFWSCVEKSIALHKAGPAVKLPPTSSASEQSQPVKIASLVEKFKQVILYGPPGTGKTRLARIAAANLAGVDIDAFGKIAPTDKIALVVFHPAYEYDQFIGGLAPKVAGGSIQGFEPREGAFVEFARRARSDAKNEYILLIDEINRGNLPKLLGELLYALEYRDEPVRLSYKPDTDFVVPKNLYILATMNSADKSIGLVDVAVRRRFAFHRMAPSAEVVSSSWKESDPDVGQRMVSLMGSINAEIDEAADPYREMGVGHSYFMKSEAFVEKGDFQTQWAAKIQPLLVEYHQQGWLKKAPRDADAPPETVLTVWYK
jgi:hypothetical protein